jgi:hypothetical protein
VKVEEPPPPPIIQEASSPIQARVKGGVGDWSKQKGRDENVDLSKLDVLLEKEELDLDVNPTVSSRFKQPKSAISWDKSKGIGRFEEAKSATNDLDYGDVDPGKFKKGPSKGATNMTSSTGRGAEEEKDLFKKMLGNEEVLDVIPDDSVMMRNKSSSSFGKSSSSRSLLSDDEKKKGTANKVSKTKKNTNNSDDILTTTNTTSKKTVSFGETTEKKIADLDLALNKNIEMISPPPTPLISVPDSNRRSPPKKDIDVTTSQMIEKLDQSLKQMIIDK